MAPEPTRHTFASRTVSFVCISDTHDDDYRSDVPSGDVLVHAGDMTDYGTEQSLTQAYDWLVSLPHKVKVVIAGNHDLGLDKDHANFNAALLKMFSSAEAKAEGIFYLHDEVQTIAFYQSADESLKPLRVYGNPRQPDFLNSSYAFTYKPHPSVEATEAWAGAPDFADGVQIWVTHGAPDKRLDWINIEGLHGCEAQANAVAKAKPVLCVFGHYHVSNGIEVGRWCEDSDVERSYVGTSSIRPQKRHYLFDGVDEFLVRSGERTVYVNAAYMTGRKREIKERNLPFVIQLELP